MSIGGILHTDTTTGTDINGSAAQIASFSPNADAWLDVKVSFAGLATGVEQTLTITADTGDPEDIGGSTVKRPASESGFKTYTLAAFVKATETLTIKAESSSTSDTSVSTTTEFIDAAPAMALATDSSGKAQIDPIQAGQVIHGQPVTYVAHDGNDATSGATLKATVEAASDGDLVMVGAGTFDLGSNVINMPDGVSVKGAGIDTTSIKSTPALATPVLSLASRVRIADLTVLNPSSGYPIAARSKTATDIRIVRVKTVGDIDGIFVNVDSPDVVEVVAIDYEAESGFDCVSAFGTGAARIDLYNPKLLTKGPSSFGFQYARGVIAGGTNSTDLQIRVFGGSIDASNSDVKTTAASAEEGGTVELWGVSMTTEASSGSVFDLEQSSTGVLKVADSAYDPTKTSGAITQIDTPGNVTGDVQGKVLGGGSSSITGVGARVLDANGQALATDSDMQTALASLDQIDGNQGRSLDDLATPADVTGSSLKGSGADQVTVTFTSGGLPVENAQVWITTDSTGTNVFAGTLITDSDGQATFLLDDGNTYYFWAQKQGVQSILGEEFIAQADQ